MNRFFILLFAASLTTTLWGCRNDGATPVAKDPDPIANTPNFKQENTYLRSSHVQCLINKWHEGQLGKDTVTLVVINDLLAYQKFFSCSSPASLPSIDFNTYTLLIGYLSGTLSGVSNISGIEQSLVQTPADKYEYQVRVTGKVKGGTEWFGFCGLAGKIRDQNLIYLRMSYQVK